MGIFDSAVDFFGGDALDAIAPYASAAASFIGGSQANAANEAMAEDNRSFQAEQARIARKFNKRMSNTAHQRAMRDLERAGLNPILAARQPASSPGSPSPAGSMATINDVVTPAINTGLQTMKSTNEVKVMQKTADKLVQEIPLMTSQEWKNDVERALTSLTYNEKLMQIDILEETLKLARRDGDINETQAAQGLEWIRRFREAVFGGSPMGPLRRGR